MARADSTITRHTPPDALPCFLSVAECAILLGVSDATIREAIKTGALERVPLPSDRVLIPRGSILKLAQLPEGIAAAHERARREVAVEAARQALGKAEGDLRVAELVLKAAEESLRELRS